MWSGQDNDKINEHEILSVNSLEYFAQRQCSVTLIYAILYIYIYTWILECLELYKINRTVTAFVKNSIELWKCL